ncbi:glycosyltransferase family 4 protein [Fibrivirga algicola]|uniref:Glycosyltransferase family 4 protein n=1 Tax=Fibrivirga algicola TaxID=2950420 RepID=A0ABX0QJ45_9BACT|nr:glycosyltransferase family 4 protein [Fibrivirga algicola]NID12289.1 glycosyltransferase family 4 protein [Fibrivirga algicola]
MGQVDSNVAGKHILIIVENLPVPFDRRVWQEATTLREAGAEVSIICPQMKGYTKPFEQLEGIDIYRHPLPVEASGALGYLVEYSTSIFWWYWYCLKIFAKKRFHVIHGCNPPDLIFTVAVFFKLFGVKYVFDHHDINPELYIAKYGRKDFFYHLMIWFERLTFKTADYSIATNESYKEIAIRRGKMAPDRVTVVRSGPKLERLKLGPGDQNAKKGRTHLVGYLGVISDQEGIDLLLMTIEKVVAKRQDVQFAIVGGGTGLQEMVDLAKSMGLSDYVDFYGRVSDSVMLDVLNAADVCVNPDKPTEMNNLSTMNKIMEYMALKKPIVQFDLKEGRFSAEEASLYVSGSDVQEFADKINYLLDNPEVRTYMGEYGYDRVISKLSWNYERVKLLALYNKVLMPKEAHQQQSEHSFEPTGLRQQ